MFNAAEDNIPESSIELMQVDDEPSYHTPSRPTIPSTASTLSISDELFEEAKEELEFYIKPEHDDARIARSLKKVSLIVRETLSHDPNLKARVATEDEFFQNVKNKTEGLVIRLFKENAKKKTWRELLENDVFQTQTVLNPPPPEEELSDAAVSASVIAWTTKFQGDGANILIGTIADYLSKMRGVYTRHTSIVNSSGTGKSRLVDQVAKAVITVPICLRQDRSQGFPPPDKELRDWLMKEQPNSQVDAAKMLHAFMCSLLTVLVDHLVDLGVHDLSDTQSPEAVKQRQGLLASNFHTRMTQDQTQSRSNEYRRLFYKRVIELAVQMASGNVEPVTTAEPTTYSPPRYRFTGYGGVEEGGERLCKFIDPDGILDAPQGPRRPLAILIFDESHILTDTPENSRWTLFSELRRTLRGIVEQPIFTLFLSTAGRFNRFSPETGSDPSKRVINNDLFPLHPISEMCFDDLAYPAREYTVTLDRVVRMDWISHLGRPLFGAYYDALNGNETELLQFAKQKLLNGPSQVDSKDCKNSNNRAQTLACLAVRFALEFNADSHSRAVACEQVERHMRLCIAATTGFERLVTIAGSEPLLAEAALYLIRGSEEKHPVRHLAYHSDLHCVDRGRRGELVAALIIMQARDMAVAQTNNRWMSVGEFMKALLPLSAYETLQSSRPTLRREGEDRPFNETFDEYALWFNHVIRVEDNGMVTTEFLWRFITRGAMIVCAQNQAGVDIILPVCVKEGSLSRDTVTAIFIQVKNDKHYQKKIDKTLFDGMDPIQVALFGTSGGSPRPVIRMVFALASKEHTVDIRSRGERAGLRSGGYDEITAFDIWCAGLSSKTFRVNEKDDVSAYELLLQRSLQPHDAFELGETNDRVMNEGIKAKRGSRRRAMAALTRSEVEHHSIHFKSDPMAMEDDGES